VLPCDLSLIAIHICSQFSDIHVSQGSVATYLRCGGMFKYDSVASLLPSLSVKEFRKLVNIWGSYGQEFSVFFNHSVCLCYCLCRIFGPLADHVHVIKAVIVFCLCR